MINKNEVVAHVILATTSFPSFNIILFKSFVNFNV